MKKKMVTICFALLLTVSTIAMADAAPTYVGIPGGGKGYIEKLSGNTFLFGGGEYVGIRFVRSIAGKDIQDALFSVIWGNQTNPNSIVIYSEITRYLGAANVSDVYGGLVARRYPITVKTIWVQKLEDIFEYYDANGDEVADYSRDYTGLFYKDYLWHEPVYKMVSLNTSWTKGEITGGLNPEGTNGSWTFSLTAENLNYKQIAESLNTTGDNMLNRLTFTFHLEANLVNVTAKVPYFKVTVNATDSYDIVDSEKIEVKEFNGTRIDYGVKYDHEILGWDVDARNPNARLLLEWHAVVGNYIPGNVAEWMKEKILSKIQGGTGQAVAVTPEGNVTLTESSAATGRPILQKILKPARLHLLDDWQKIGSLTWMTEVDVTKTEGDTPVTMNMTAQIQGHKRLQLQFPNGGLYNGFAMLAGYSYPAGYKIYHDPEVTASVNIMDISEIAIGPPLFQTYLLYGAAAAIAIAIAVSTIAILKRRK